MEITPQTQAVLLFTAWLGKRTSEQPQPLTPGEWTRFTAWLVEQSATPATLLDEPQRLEQWRDSKLPVERLQRLLERSAALAIAVERWQRAGLWIISRSDALYPRRLKQRLRQNAPAVLFGAGNPELLHVGGIAVVGGRHVEEPDLAYTHQLGEAIAAQASNVVSGAAKGVDEAAMLGALQAEGTASAVMADSLLRASSSARWRNFLMDGSLVLVSAVNPEAGFNTANAMARNKFIYALSDASIVVASAHNKGGTWSGAKENLRHRWVPLWVRTAEQHPGNAELVRLGASALPDLEQLNISDLSVHGSPTAADVAVGTTDKEPASTGIFESTEAVEAGTLEEGSESGSAEVAHPCASPESQPQAEATPQPTVPISESEQAATPEASNKGLGAAAPAAELSATESLATGHQSSSVTNSEADFYEIFVEKLHQLTRTSALTPDELKDELHLHKSQVADWLKRAEDDGRVEKFKGRPPRYRATTHRTQTSLGF